MLLKAVFLVFMYSQETLTIDSIRRPEPKSKRFFSFSNFDHLDNKKSKVFSICFVHIAIMVTWTCCVLQCRVNSFPIFSKFSWETKGFVILALKSLKSNFECSSLSLFTIYILLYNLHCSKACVMAP